MTQKSILKCERGWFKNIWMKQQVSHIYTEDNMTYITSRTLNFKFFRSIFSKYFLIKKKVQVPLSEKKSLILWVAEKKKITSLQMLIVSWTMLCDNWGMWVIHRCEYDSSLYQEQRTSSFFVPYFQNTLIKSRVQFNCPGFSLMSFSFQYIMWNLWNLCFYSWFSFTTLIESPIVEQSYNQHQIGTKYYSDL